MQYTIDRIQFRITVLKIDVVAVCPEKTLDTGYSIDRYAVCENHNPRAILRQLQDHIFCFLFLVISKSGQIDRMIS